MGAFSHGILRQSRVPHPRLGISDLAVTDLKARVAAPKTQRPDRAACHTAAAAASSSRATPPSSTPPSHPSPAPWAPRRRQSHCPADASNRSTRRRPFPPRAGRGAALPPPHMPRRAGAAARPGAAVTAAALSLPLGGGRAAPPARPRPGPAAESHCATLRPAARRGPSPPRFAPSQPPRGGRRPCRYCLRWCPCSGCTASASSSSCTSCAAASARAAPRPQVSTAAGAAGRGACGPRDGSPRRREGESLPRFPPTHPGDSGSAGAPGSAWPRPRGLVSWLGQDSRDLGLSGGSSGPGLGAAGLLPISPPPLHGPAPDHRAA